MGNIVFATARDLATAICQRQVSAVEVLDAYLTQIAQRNAHFGFGLRPCSAGSPDPRGNRANAHIVPLLTAVFHHRKKAGLSKRVTQ